ncbi:hypothetical protein LCGC14_0476660 [marine sediment metagenome]|uniref:Uncharacterized protein n=1 Tax=marine sediment metagenome TaxID=412755 RepID=A0A0F9VJF9_9ZZZZ|nr:hypothetical protein [bacterium]
MIDNYNQPDQVEWNLSSAVIGQIQSLLEISSRAYLNGNLSKAFWCLKASKFRFIQSLNPKERKSLRNMEMKFMKAMKQRKKSMMAYLYEEYTEKLMDYLEAYGYLIPKKKDSTRIS